jgi:hypothetical protein
MEGEVGKGIVGAEMTMTVGRTRPRFRVWAEVTFLLCLAFEQGSMHGKLLRMVNTKPSSSNRKITSSHRSPSSFPLSLRSPPLLSHQPHHLCSAPSPAPSDTPHTASRPPLHTPTTVSDSQASTPASPSPLPLPLFLFPSLTNGQHRPDQKKRLPKRSQGGVRFVARGRSSMERQG